NSEIKLLQEMLAKNKTIYPEGIVSGYYGKMTVRAVQRFQCAYNIVCGGSPRATGYGVFGPKTRKVFDSIYGL
ncbi:MAG TPA: peptidoglycan-binding protein, partial [Candidatus Kaiserbacteria bacterium]|nr:peptidoglycan-binding protein [Candidatus Kaiserbacteria bacterium]